MSNKTTISATLPTPMWARWVFRVFAILTTVATFIVSSDPSIEKETVIRIIVYLKGADMLILALANMFGVRVEKS